MAGSLIQWLRDNLGIIKTRLPTSRLWRPASPDSGGCAFVPAFAGLFAPHWRRDARGVIAGLTGYVTKAHIARAALEVHGLAGARRWSTPWRPRAGVALTTLKADGGMTANNLLMQFQADVLDVPVVRPRVAETTCLGAAYAAGLAVGYWRDQEALKVNWKADRQWRPAMKEAVRDEGYRRWTKAVQRTLDWV